MTRGIGAAKPQGVVSLDHIDTRGRPCRQFSGRPEDVDALVDICLRATVTARQSPRESPTRSLHGRALSTRL